VISGALTGQLGQGIVGLPGFRARPRVATESAPECRAWPSRHQTGVTTVTLSEGWSITVELVARPPRGRASPDGAL